MMKNEEKAAARFKQGFSCSQSVLWVFAERFGMDLTTALKVSTAFGGGMGRTGQTCGAVTGALMAIGLKFGRTRAEDVASKEKTYDLVNQFMEEFNKRHGSVLCPVLLGADLQIPLERERAETEHLFDAVCPTLVRDAVTIMEGLLQNENQDGTLGRPS